MYAYHSKVNIYRPFFTQFLSLKVTAETSIFQGYKSFFLWLSCWVVNMSIVTHSHQMCEDCCNVYPLYNSTVADWKENTVERWQQHLWKKAMTNGPVVSLNAFAAAQLSPVSPNICFPLFSRAIEYYAYNNLLALLANKTLFKHDLNFFVYLTAFEGNIIFCDDSECPTFPFFFLSKNQHVNLLIGIDFKGSM